MLIVANGLVPPKRLFGDGVLNREAQPVPLVLWHGFSKPDTSKRKEDPTWKNYLALFSAFCESSGFKLAIDEELTFTTIDLHHNISEVFTDIMEGVWKKIANRTKELKFESCIKTNISVIIKFEKIKR